MKAILALCSIGLSCSVLSAGQITVTKYEYSMVQQIRTPDGKIAENTLQQITYRALDGRQRTDMGNGTVQIAQPETKSVFLLSPDKKTYRQLLPPAPGTPKTGEAFLVAGNQGTKEILGLTCGKAATPANGEGSYFETWTCRDPANPTLAFNSKKAAETILQRKDGTGYHLTLRRITPNVRVAATLFEIPADFQLSKAPQ